MKALLTPQEAAEALGVSHHAVRAWARRAHDPLPTVIVGTTGSHLRIVAAEMHAWLARQTATAAVR